MKGIANFVITTLLALAINGLVWWYCYGFMAKAFGWPHLNYSESLCVIVLFSVFWNIWRINKSL